MTGINNKSAVITGASSGIGRAISQAWSASGGEACLLGRSLSRLTSVIAEAAEMNTSLRCLRVDLAQDQEVRSVCVQIGQQFPRLDLLVHCAGVAIPGRLEEAPVDDFDLQYRVNLRAPYLMTQLLLPLIRAAQGQIVFVNSSAGLAAGADFSQYAATKHALKGVADSLRQEINPDGVRVLSVYPGRTASPMQERLCRLEGREYHPERLLQPEDVALAIMNAFGLASSAEITDLNVRPMKK